jgi:hypothetical protein
MTGARRLPGTAAGPAAADETELFHPGRRGQRAGYPRRARKRGQAMKGHTFQEDGFTKILLHPANA